MDTFLTLSICFIFSTKADLQLPKWSWDTLQSMTFFQGCNATGTEIAFNSTALDIISRYNVITIEKGQGENSTIPNWYYEDYMLAAAKQIKSVSPTAQVGMYLNSVLDWTQYRLHQAFLNHPEWWLRNATGAIIRGNGDHHFNNNTGLLEFDMSKDALTKFWSSACLNLTNSPYVSTCVIGKVYFYFLSQTIYIRNI